MDLPVHIGLSVIDDRVSVFVQPLVRLQLIAVYGRSRIDVLAYVALNCLLASIRNDSSADLTVTFQNSGDYGLTEIIQLACFIPLPLMHVASLSADHGFV